MSIKIKIELNEGLFLRDPQNSILGRKIIQHSILMIEKIGFESFNFKKLSAEINSTEVFFYRYFNNNQLFFQFICQDLLMYM